jgi:hypothetical protein
MGKIYDNLREKIPERITFPCPICKEDLEDDFGKESRVFSCPRCEARLRLTTKANRNADLIIIGAYVGAMLLFITFLIGDFLRRAILKA